MSARALVLLSALVAGCGLVSGLDSLGVDDGGTPPDASDAAQANDDVNALEDGAQDVVPPPPIDAGTDTGPHALASEHGCSSVPGDATLSLSGSDFTIELWLQLKAAVASSEIFPIVWKGGRAANEPGWSLVLTTQGVAFCVADSTASKCTGGYNANVGELLHIGAVGALGQNNTRNVQLYVRNSTKSEATHYPRGGVSGVASWTSSVPFTIGGAKAQQALCANAPNIVVDAVHVYSVALTAAQLDADLASPSCNATGLLAYFRFDEGSGLVANDCTANKLVMTLGTNASFVASPFP